MALMWKPNDIPVTFKFGDTDLTPYIDALTSTPAKVADNPHAPGTPEHREWEQANVHNPRQLHAPTRQAAKVTADERLANLKATYMRRGSAPTFAYGKGVDDLLAFIADDEATDPDAVTPGQLLTRWWLDDSMTIQDWAQQALDAHARKPFTLPGGIA